MALITDSNGFILPIVFLILSLVIMLMTYKKKTKWVWLSIVPMVVMFFHRGQIDEHLIEKEQYDFIVSTWSETYRPLTIRVEPYRTEDDVYDEWKIETDGGSYLVHFYKGESDGYEVFEVLNETETLQMRANVLSTLYTLNIEGEPVFNANHNIYTVYTPHTEYTITINNQGRVDTITDDSEYLIYKNEEHLPDETGRTLREEEVK